MNLLWTFKSFLRSSYFHFQIVFLADKMNWNAKKITCGAVHLFALKWLRYDGL